MLTSRVTQHFSKLVPCLYNSTAPGTISVSTQASCSPSVSFPLKSPPPRTSLTPLYMADHTHLSVVVKWIVAFVSGLVVKCSQLGVVRNISLLWNISYIQESACYTYHLANSYKGVTPVITTVVKERRVQHCFTVVYRYNTVDFNWGQFCSPGTLSVVASGEMLLASSSRGQECC